MMKKFNYILSGHSRCYRGKNVVAVSSAGENDERTVTDLLIDQIEFADVIILNKMDLVNEEQALEVKAIITALNPGA